MPQAPIFEHPLNERMRTFMRLEHLFERLARFANEDDPLATRVTIETLIDIAQISARTDVKSELLKELDRATDTLKRLTNRPGVDPDALRQVLDELRAASAAIHGIHGPIGQGAREDEFLKSIAQRTSIPGGSCGFDLPHFHHWLLQPREARQARLAHWLADLTPAQEALRLLLSLTRTSAPMRSLVAEHGFYQESLETPTPPQLLRIQLAKLDGLYPEISGHKNRFSIRFMWAEHSGRPTQTDDDIPFQLSCCVL